MFEVVNYFFLLVVGVDFVFVVLDNMLYSLCVFIVCSFFFILWIVLLVLLLVWEVLVCVGVFLLQVLFVFSKVLQMVLNLIVQGCLLLDFGVSFLCVVVGFVIGGSIGFVFGMLVGFLCLVEVLVDCSVQMVCVVFFLVVLLLVIVWFGVGEGGKVFLVLLGVLFFIYINIVLGICQVDFKLLELGCVIGLFNWILICCIVLFGVLLLILVGVCYVLVVVWLVLVIVEIIVVNIGIGLLVMDVCEFLQIDVIVLIIVIYVGIGVVFDGIVCLLECCLLVWYFNYVVKGK